MTLRRLNFFLKYIVIAMAVVLSSAASIGAFEAPKPGQPVLVIAPPWTGGAARVIDRLNGREIALERAPFGALAVLDAPERARDAGAWAIMDGRFVARLCGVEI